MPEIIGIAVLKKTYTDSVNRLFSNEISERKAIMKEALDSVLKAQTAKIKKLYLSGPTSDQSITQRRFRSTTIKGETRWYSQETSRGVEGSISFGEGIDYTSMHIRPDAGNITVTTGGRFTIPLPHVRNADGSWKAPYKPGNLRYVPGLFRGGKGLNKDILWQRRGKTVIPMFVLKKQVTFPSRVPMEDIRIDVREDLKAAMDKVFTGFDFGYVRSQKQ